MRYYEMTEKHQKETNEFPMFFAFSNSQFEEGMKKVGLDPKDTDKIYKVGGTGGFIRKTDSKKLSELFDRHDRELEELKKDDAFLLDAIKYELANHEYCITYDHEETVNILGLDMKDERTQAIFKEARKKYLDHYNK